MANLQEKTTIYKGFNGWTGETFTNVNSKTYRITTLKTYSKRITSCARVVETLPNGAISFSMFSGEDIDLITENARATQKTISEIHTKALLIFDEKVKETNSEQPYKIERGQILFLNGYGQDLYYHKKLAIYQIEETDWGKNYLYVNLDTLELGSTSGILTASEDIFGIGIYYIKNEKISIDELNNAVLDAKAKEIQKAKEAESSKLLESTLVSAKIEEGKKLVNVPSWAKCVIVADNYTDESDSMTDYFHTSIESTFYLAFSKTTRNNMNELKKAANNWSDTMDLVKNETTSENTGGHSYLPDYFIGSSRWYGLKINKRKYFDLTKEDNLNRLYIAAAEGRYFIPSDKKTSKDTTVKNDTDKLQFIDYSEKAFAIIGDTKPIKDQLKSLGGRFNFRLKCGAGWIFSKKNKTEVLKALNL